jgi:uncharacterized protein YecT (DUF1311 family)
MKWTLVILLLGMSPPALAMDCRKATSPIDKTICADPAALAADQELEKAYTALYSRASEADKKQILQSQRSWLKQRVNSCSDEKKPSAKCLIDLTQNRTLFLQGKSQNGPGTGHDLTPLIIEQAGSAKLYEEDIALMKFPAPALPGEKLFNTAIDKLLKDVPTSKDSDDMQDMIYIYDLTLHLIYASPQFLSASVETYAFEGGAHGNSGTSGINIDVANGKLLTFTDVFEPSAHQKLEDSCLSQIRVQRREKSMDDEIDPKTLKEMRGTIHDTIGRLDSWFFSSKDGTVTFDPYAVGSYAEGSYTCVFPSGVLKPLYNAGSVLP